MNFVLSALLLLLWSPVVAFAQWDSTAVEFAKSLQSLNPDKFEKWEEVFLPNEDKLPKWNGVKAYSWLRFDAKPNAFRYLRQVPYFEKWCLWVHIDGKGQQPLFVQSMIDSLVQFKEDIREVEIKNVRGLPVNIKALDVFLNWSFQDVDTVDLCMLSGIEYPTITTNNSFIDSSTFECLPRRFFVGCWVSKSNYYDIPKALESIMIGPAPKLPAPKSRIIRAWVPRKGVRLMFDANLIDVVEHSVYDTMRFFPVDYLTYNDYAYGLPAKAAYRPKAKERRWDGRVLRQKQIVNIRTIEQYKKEYKWSQKALWKRRLRYRLLVFCSYF